MNTEITKSVNKVSTADAIAGKETTAAFLGRLRNAVLSEVNATIQGYEAMILREHRLDTPKDQISALWGTKKVYDELAEVIELASSKAMKVHNALELTQELCNPDYNV